MPQFDPDPFLAEAVWTLIAFGLLFVLLSRFVLPRLERIIEERRRAIEQEIDQARRLREQAEAMRREHGERMARAHEEVRRMFQDAEARLREEREAIMREWRAELKRSRARLVEDLEIEKNRALREIRAHAGEFIAEATERLIRKEVDPELAKRIAEEMLEELARGDDGR